jgi:uncharacterized protein (TIGR03086 family)
MVDVKRVWSLCGRILDMALGPGELHLAVCQRFSAAVGAADGRWDRPSPCAGWDARDVLEHVIGFHDVLLLRPLGLKPKRPRDDPGSRWSSTLDGLEQALRRDGLFEQVVEVPAVGTNSSSRLNAMTLMPRLSQDVLVHTWDLARAVGADDRLDPGWCALFIDKLPPDPDALSASGMFGRPITVGGQADEQSQLLGRLGRDPSWKPPG